LEDSPVPASARSGFVAPGLAPIARLQRMARWMRGLIAIGAAALTFAAVTLWSTGTGPLYGRAVGAVATAGLPDTTRLSEDVFGQLRWLTVPGVLLGLFTLLQAWRLFGAYGRGQVFGPPAVRPLRALAWSLVATSLWQMLASMLGVVAVTWHNAPGKRQLVLGISWDNYLGLLFGGLLLAIAWAMTEAARIEQDNAGFV